MRALGGALMAGFALVASGNCPVGIHGFVERPFPSARTCTTDLLGPQGRSNLAVRITFRDAHGKVLETVTAGDPISATVPRVSGSECVLRASYATALPRADVCRAQVQGVTRPVVLTYGSLAARAFDFDFVLPPKASHEPCGCPHPHASPVGG